MKVTVEDHSSVKKTMHIEVPAEEVTREIDKAYASLRKTAKVKGFRPGKTPRSVLERIYGKDVGNDVSANLIQSAFLEALKETKLNIVAMPKIDPPELKANVPYAFTASVEVRPEIDDIDYKGFELKKSKYAVSDDEIDKQLEMLQQNMAQRKLIETDRPVQTGDLAVVDYEGFKDGKPHKEIQKTENFFIKVGGNHVVKELDEGLVGMTVGEEKEIEAVFPDDYFNKELAGETILFKVKLNEIREEILPEIDDELAKSISDKFGTLDAIKDQIRENLQSGYDKRVEQELNEQIFKRLLAQADFEVPDSMVDAELEQIIKDTEQRFSQNNRSLEEVGLSKESLAEKYRETAEKQVRRHLILNKLIDQDALKLSDEDLEKGFQEMADAYNQPVDQIKSYYSQNQEGLSFFKHALLEKQVLKIIIDNGNIIEVEPKETGQEEDATADETA